MFKYIVSVCRSNLGYSEEARNSVWWKCGRMGVCVEWWGGGGGGGNAFSLMGLFVLYVTTDFIFVFINRTIYVIKMF